MNSLPAEFDETLVLQMADVQPKSRQPEPPEPQEQSSKRKRTTRAAKLPEEPNKSEFLHKNRRIVYRIVYRIVCFSANCDFLRAFFGKFNFLTMAGRKQVSVVKAIDIWIL